MAARAAYALTTPETMESGTSTEEDNLNTVDALECPDELESLPQLVSVDSRDDDVGCGACSAFEDSDDDDLEVWDVIDDPALTVEALEKIPMQPPPGGSPAEPLKIKSCLRPRSKFVRVLVEA